MGVRHQQLVEQLVPLLKFYVAYPTSVNQANAGARSLRNYTRDGLELGLQSLEDWGYVL